MLSDFRSTYFENATAARDYRVQLRGNRPILLFGIYLFVLMAVAFVVYETQASGQATSVVQAQQMLNMFYTTVMAMLGGMIALIAPALTATTIVQERQRHSFDLVFSAPVTPKYYLVGKVIASYRYVWMLLALSLPVTAASVVLGGAAWSDVLIGYLLLSLQGLLFTALALLMSTVAAKPVSAVMWTYAAIILTLMMASSFLPMLFFGGSRGREQFFLIAMNPFTVTMATDTFTMILGREIPNWIIASVVTLLIVRIVLLTAGSLLSFYGGREGRMLRINGLVYTFLVMMLIGYLNGTSAWMSPADSAISLGRMLFWWMVPLIVFIPFMTCYGYDGERVHWPNGMFDLRRTFDGTPAGALPFILTVILSATVGILAGVWTSRLAGAAGVPTSGLGILRLEFLSYLLFTIGFWTMAWGFGQLASITGNTKSARTIQFALVVIAVVLPAPFLSATIWQQFGEPGISLWYVWVLYPLFRDFSTIIPFYGIAMFGIGWILAVRSERLNAYRVRQDLIEDERLYARS